MLQKNQDRSYQLSTKKQTSTNQLTSSKTSLKKSLRSKKQARFNAPLASLLLLGLFLSLLVAISGCSGRGGKGKADTLTGAGATFPFPLYSKMFDEYYKATEIKVNYQSIGSGGGIRQLLEETVSFGASDAYVSDKMLAEVRESGRELIHLPIVLGAVVITYNLPELNETIQLSGATIAEVFNGNITRWNAPQLVAQNPALAEVDQPIIVIRRSDGSGTTYAFSDFLAKNSPDWKASPGVGKALDWFGGSVGAKGNEGVTAQVKGTPYSIGYVSLNYALASELPTAKVQNDVGEYIVPTVESVSKAAATELAPDTKTALTSVRNPEGGYPISTFTWLLFFAEQNYKERTAADADALKALLSWMITDGQQYAKPLYYAPLPEEVVEQGKAILEKITYTEK